MGDLIPFRRTLVRRPESRFAAVPVVEQAFFVLNQAVIGIPLTTRGNFARQFVQSFWHKYLQPSDSQPLIPFRQDDCPELVKIQFMLNELGWIKREKNEAVITPSGREWLSRGDFAEMYGQLLVIYIDTWNWACEDHYPEHDFIQDAAVDLLDALLYSSGDEVAAEPLFNEVFAELEEELTSRAGAIAAVRLRFFERFCIPFGLLRPSGEKRYRKTDLLPDGLSQILDQVLVPELL